MLDVAIWSEIYTLFEPLPRLAATGLGNRRIIPQRRICIAPGSPRNAKLLPPLDHPAVPIPGRPVPDTAPKSLRGG